MSRYLQNHL